jgi:hypothetical protein
VTRSARPPATLAGLALAAALLAGPPPAARAAPPSLAGCPVFPEDHAWNARVDTLPVHPLSDAYVGTIGRSTGLHPDFGAGTWNGGPIGIPFTTVGGAQPRVPVAFDYDDQSDPGPYPIPPDAPIEGGPASGGDRHVLVLDRDACVLYELYAAYPQPDGSWAAGSGAVFDLRSYALRPATWTSADAAGLAILPGLVRYEEVAAGEIRHAIRFTASLTQRAFVWPARHQASWSTDPARPPMGQRFRLKAAFDVTPFPPQVRVILQAMKTYGIILADNGSNWYVSGAPDPRWDDDALVSSLRQVRGEHFEAVDASSLMVDPDSGRVRAPTFAGGVYVAGASPGAPPGLDLVTGAGPGGGPHVRTFAAAGAPAPAAFLAFAPGFAGGVRVAACDLGAADGRAALVVGAGPGGGPHVRVVPVDALGQPGPEVASFFAYAPAFAGGVFVACGDLDGDGTPEVIVGPDAGGGPHVRALRLQADAPGGVVPLLDLLAYDPAFRGGVRVAAGRLDGGTRDLLILAPGPGGGPHVRVLRLGPAGPASAAEFFAYAPGFAGGVFVAAGDVTGDGRAEIVTGADAGGGAHVRAFTGQGADAGVSFLAFPAGFAGGVRVGAADATGDGRAEILAAAGPGGGPHVRVIAVGAGSGPPAEVGGFLAY